MWVARGVRAVAIIGIIVLQYSYAAGEVDYKQRMRDFVQDISRYAKKKDPGFCIVPQNGHELMREGGDSEGMPVPEYIEAVDGAGQEDLFYGYVRDNAPTPIQDTEYLIFFLDATKSGGVAVLVTDYCWDRRKMDDAFELNSKKGYVSFQAPERDLDVIPDYPRPIRNENANDVTALKEAKNFLYLLDPGGWSGKKDYIRDLSATNYDVIIMDAFFEDENGDQRMLASEDVLALKRKRNGGRRLVISYMSIGEAEEYRYYWRTSWKRNPPSWLAGENPDWPGNYKVKYWDPEWRAVIFGSRDAYLDRIIAAGFNGVYLDIIDAFEYFE
ncbi:MAG: endo alpha-1,4 polygalactosaminidase [Spirochaetes bacterium]|nr:endo alpha-1,4 polygalactosaminidase [Spirochaetota bacterium]